MRQKVCMLVLLVLLASLLPMLSIVDLADANWIMSPEPMPTDHAYIRSDGSIEPATLPIQSNGTKYRLTADIVNCTLEIEKSNIEIDGRGFSMYIPQYGETGEDGQVKSVGALISLKNQTDITVKNFVLRDSGIAISAFHCSSINIADNKVTNCRWIYLHNCTYSSITGNVMYNNRHGLYGYDVNHLQIKYNQIRSSGWHAVILEFISESDIIGNVFANSNGRAICYLGSNNRVIGNVFQNNDDGILSYMDNNEIHHNNFINDGIAIEAPNILDDGKEGNYWSINKQTGPLTMPSVFIKNTQVNVDHHPRLTPYVFDYQAPAVEITSPLTQSNFVPNSTFTLNFTTSKQYAKAAYSFDGNQKINLQNQTLDLTGLPLGTHQLTIYAEDKFGNEGSQTICFTISEPTPKVDALNAPPFGGTFAVLLVLAATITTAACLLVLRNRKKKNGLK